jgi:hypothetical protein
MTTSTTPFLLSALLLLPLAGASAQMIDDGIMMGKQTYCAGDLYTHDQWSSYWEGPNKRQNFNIGTLTTQTNLFYADLGITNRLNLIFQVPEVWTHASQGVLHDQQGFQDVTLAVKIRALNHPVTKYGRLSLIVEGVATIPMTSYEPDFQPLSIGTHSKSIAERTTVSYQTHTGWYASFSGAYTWRRHVTLDQLYYYTNGQFFDTSVVPMPSQFDYKVSAGYHKGLLTAELNFSQQNTQGGGDIRPQDLPFISNRVDFKRPGFHVMVPINKFHLKGLSAMVDYSQVDYGRNVGQSYTVTTGLLYLGHYPLPWSKKP